MRSLKKMIYVLILAFVNFQMALAENSIDVQSVNPPYLKADYSFPYANPYFSSLTVKLLKNSSLEPVMFDLQGLWKRNQIPGFEAMAQIKVSAFIQKNKAPLVYVIPGLGSHAVDGGGLYLAEQLYLKGYSAMVIPSPLFWRFALTQSSTGIVGYPPADAQDLRRFMLQARMQAEHKYHMTVSKVAAVGYSLGAINAAFIMKLEREHSLLGLQGVVMINPPLRLSVAIDELDRLNGIGSSLSSARKQFLWAYLFDKGGNYLYGDIRKAEYFAALDKKFKLSAAEVQYLIGSSFQQTLADTIYVGQNVQDLGLIDLKADRSAARFAAAQLSYNDYLTKAVWPFWTKQLHVNWSLKEFIAKGDLLSLKSLFAKDDSFRLLHNMDDYLTLPEDIKEMASVMGRRVVIYPTGGHIGNMWKVQNLDDMHRMVKDLLK